MNLVATREADVPVRAVVDSDAPSVAGLLLAFEIDREVCPAPGVFRLATVLGAGMA